MPSCHFTVVFILALFSISTISTTPYYYSCSEDFFLMTRERNMKQCKKLSTLGFEFGWNYHNGSFIDVFIGAKLQYPVAGWMAWGVNPHDKPQMVGTRALIGIKHPNGSLIIKTYSITGDIKLGCKLLPSKIDVEVQNMKFEYSIQTQYYTIFATLSLPSVYNISRLNHLWQTGYAALGSEPKMHPSTLQNVDSSETINLYTGRSKQSVGVSRRHLRTAHAILNIIGWGVLMPSGVIAARYFKKFPFENMTRWWFCLHVSLQIGGYILGTSGWAIGLWLGGASKYYSFGAHRILAMLIFSFTSLQMFALCLRPKADDEYRKYWNIYHHFLGYALLVLISVNILEGIAILKADHTWRKIYIGLIVSITLALESVTWIKFLIYKLKRNAK
ncbi:hypothetical protein F0562_010071 [Nyssa sinensis]|uniref:Cytochrome b561 and DOMON domain-containing protein n=1 Tax=Nyssa sinensis TaxID=561372 RepID=A0A5J5A127_9ASTE|nr:hypothetical protein F0562_010071 [Nyssa sinensis]